MNQVPLGRSSMILIFFMLVIGHCLTFSTQQPLQQCWVSVHSREKLAVVLPFYKQNEASPLSQSVRFLRLMWLSLMAGNVFNITYSELSLHYLLAKCRFKMGRASKKGVKQQMLRGMESEREEQIVWTSQMRRVMLMRTKTVGDRFIRKLMNTSSRSSYLLCSRSSCPSSSGCPLISTFQTHSILSYDQYFQMLTPIIQVLTPTPFPLHISHSPPTHARSQLFSPQILILHYNLTYSIYFAIVELFIIIIMNIFLQFEGQTQVCTLGELRDLLLQNQKSGNIVTFTTQGKICSSSFEFSNHQTIVVQSKLYGGKGGFGAKLKTEGGKKVRPNENMFSRDLQGQPVAYATINREYEDYYRKKLIENQKVEKQLADFQIVSNTYKEEYASTKLDSTYNAQMQENQKRLKDAMKIGIKKYLEKKNECTKKQQGQKQEEKDEEMQKFQEDLVREQQNESKEIEGVKRSKPIGKVDVEQQKREPQKKVKPNETEAETDKKSQLKCKSSGQKLLSARQKLKSLFKK